MSNPVQQAILDRRSIRDYKPEPLTDIQLSTLTDAALASPSAMNAQPWHFSVVRDQALLNRVHEAAKVEAMKRPESFSPRFLDASFQMFYHAPAVIFLSASKQAGRFSDIDCGIAVQNIALAAQGMGLGSVILGLPLPAFEGTQADTLRADLRFPDGYDFRICIAVGTAAATKPAHPTDPQKIRFVG